MASAKNNSNSKTNKQGSKPRSKSSITSKKANQHTYVNEDNTVSFADLFHAFSKTKAFRFIVIILAIAAVFCIDLLVSMNSYDLFFTILGFEIITVALVWVVRIALGSSKSSKNLPTSGPEGTNNVS